MTEMINGYRKSCLLVRVRIGELNKQLNELKKASDSEKIASLDLERRIALLYTEHRQMQDIIEHLSAYMRRTEQRVKTTDIL